MYLFEFVFVLLILIIYAQFPPERNCNNTQFECDDRSCINKNSWCRRYRRNCRDGSDWLNCGKYYPGCLSNQSYCAENRKCIPMRWSCDGYQDCPAGSDETECLPGGYRIKDIPGVESSKSKAKSWLLGRRRDWGWKKDTARAIVALYLSNVTEFTEGNLTSELMLKELKIHIAEFLLRNSSQPVTSHQLALFIHALLATCQDPRNFFNFNLVDELHRRMKRSQSPNPFIALALCNANKTLSVDHVVQLLKLTLHQVKPERIDSHALASMALSCLRNRNKMFPEFTSDIFQNRTLYSNMNSSTEVSKFLSLQMKDGSFGSIYSTALVLQAMLATSEEITGSNIVDAISYLLFEQKENGVFNDIMSTYMILPLLYGKTLVDLGNVNCSKHPSSNLTVQEEFDMKDGGKQKVGYSIWVGAKQDVTFNMYMRIPINITFFDVMRLAAELDTRYRFQYVSYPWGKYTYSIFDIVNDPEAIKYWQLHRIFENEEIYLDQTPDKVIPKDRERYVYWYKPTSNLTQ